MSAVLKPNLSPRSPKPRRSHGSAPHSVKPRQDKAMSAAGSLSIESPSANKVTPLHRSSLTANNLQANNLQANVRQLPNFQRMPFWLRSLLATQNSLSVIAALLVIAVLAVYGKIAYSNEVWSREYLKLEHLRRSQRQITSATEALKNNLAQQVERPGSTYVVPVPAHAIFLKPAPVQTSPITKPVANAAKDLPQTPLGY